MRPLRLSDLPDHVRAAAGLPLSGKAVKRVRALRPRTFTACWYELAADATWQLELDGLELPGLNGRFGLIRGKWRARRAFKAELELIMRAAPGGQPWLP